MKSILNLILVLLFAGLSVQAQDIDLNEKIPMDPNVVVGKLDNGLTYYIRQNSQPENRAQFWLVVNAGAILEDADQNGLAHMCEHLAFNGTERFKKHEIIHYLQSIGMKFGPEINAFTGHDVTNYMLQKVPVDVKENIDTSLMILYEWASKVAFEGEEIDNERGVIHEEWRSGRGPEFRMMNTINETLYKDSKYARHNVIGDIDIVDNCEYETLRRFYRDWYRPDLQAIVAVGDFDVAVIEKKIKDMFSAIPKRENPRDRKIFEVPDHNDTRVAIVTDNEAQYTIAQIFYKHDPVEEKSKVSYYKQLLMTQLFNEMTNNRLSELLLQADPPFAYGYCSHQNNVVKSKAALFSLAVAKNNAVDAAMKALLIENERLNQYGFAQSELERAKTSILSRFEKAFKERNKTESSNYSWEYFQHYLNNDPTPGVEWEYNMANKILPSISLEEMNMLPKKWISEENRVLAIMAPEKEDAVIPTKEEVLQWVNEVKSMNIEPYVDKVSDEPLISEVPEAGKVGKKKKNKALGFVEWKLKNGITVVLKPTDFKDDQILFSAFSYGGSSLYEAKDLMSVDLTTDLIENSGISRFDQIELEKKLAGTVVNVSPFIAGEQEGFRGSSSVSDFETMLKLIHLYFTNPRFDKKAFSSLITRYKGMMDNRSADPRSAFRDTVQVVMARYSDRARPMSSAMLDEANFNRIKYIYNGRFGDPSNFTFFFVGNIDLKEVKPLIETYLGSLPLVNRTESWKDDDIRPPKGMVKKMFRREMETPKGTAYIAVSGEYEYNAKNMMLLGMLNDILDIRYTESIREEESGTYGVGVWTSQNHYPYEGYVLNIRFSCDPVNVEKLTAIVYEEIETLKKEGPKAKDLHNVKENMLKERKESLKKNDFWLSTLKSLYFHEKEIKSMDEFNKLIESITDEDIKAAANNYYGDNITEIIMLPKEKLSKEKPAEEHPEENLEEEIVE